MSIESVRKRLEAATPGPWEASGWDHEEFYGAWKRVGPGASAWESYASSSQKAGLYLYSADHDYRGDEKVNDADAELTAHAPTDLALLLAVVDAAKVLADLASVAYAPFEDALEALEASI